jgi:hypothetical protein
LFIVLSASSATPQEPLRLSLAGADAARARRQAASTLAYDNLRLGPTAWAFDAALGLEANDNIRLESTLPRSDLIFRPQLGAHMLWRVSDINSLTLAAGLGYSAYVWHPEFNRFFITPGSEVSLDLYAGDFWINVHDRFSINENTYQDPTVVGSADSSQLVNAAGLQTTWDLNQLILKLGYDHVNYVWLQGGAQAHTGQPSGASEVFSGSAGYTFRPGLVAGLELGGSLFDYWEPTMGVPYSHATGWNVGGFAEAQLTDYIQGRVSAGYTVYTPDLPQLFRQFYEYSGLYARAELEHRVNRYLTSNLTGGRTINFAFYGGTVDMYYLRWHGDWHLLKKLSLATTFTFEHGTQLAFNAETFDRYGPGITLGRQLTEKLNAHLAYQFYWRGSDQPSRNYTVNIGTLNFAYRF